eukprot:COSAG01_NODE_14407_length_1458_cov_2.484180_1_plen_193_part_00
MNGVLSDLYSVEFYREVLATLGRHGMLVTQATGLLATKGAFWSIEATMRTALAQTQAERSAANVEAETEAGQGQGQGQGQGAGAGAGAGAGEDRPGREAARMQPPDREEGGAGWARPYKAYVPSWGVSLPPPHSYDIYHRRQLQPERSTLSVCVCVCVTCATAIVCLAAGLPACLRACCSSCRWHGLPGGPV